METGSIYSDDCCWIGDPKLVQAALEAEGAETDQDGHFITYGLKAEYLMDHGDDLKIDPQTWYFVNGQTRNLLRLMLKKENQANGNDTLAD